MLSEDAFGEFMDALPVLLFQSWITYYIFGKGIESLCLHATLSCVEVFAFHATILPYHSLEILTVA